MTSSQSAASLKWSKSVRVLPSIGRKERVQQGSDQSVGPATPKMHFLDDGVSRTAMAAGRALDMDGKLKRRDPRRVPGLWALGGLLLLSSPLSKAFFSRTVLQLTSLSINKKPDLLDSLLPFTHRLAYHHHHIHTQQTIIRTSTHTHPPTPERLSPGAIPPDYYSHPAICLSPIPEKQGFPLCRSR
ncbi:hypothetical protein IF1G_02547 [Cordyceps javanica]|uniref:Uncharacterized protein n=1 Tax=Cordyceps javanica TaxID=43265 RepID=A0A545W6R6_9HYPO|nr:hypothetical protein IF1G_02547 [Cordyceps javanica]TQW09683.1 hypothetical protein IF2G_02473 [Cordyceps javanica]